jgi:hypothetical protein
MTDTPHGHKASLRQRFVLALALAVIAAAALAALVTGVTAAIASTDDNPGEGCHVSPPVSRDVGPVSPHVSHGVSRHIGPPCSGVSPDASAPGNSGNNPHGGPPGNTP